MESILSIFDYLYGWSRYMETHIASVETVLVYNLGGVSSSKVQKRSIYDLRKHDQ